MPMTLCSPMPRRASAPWLIEVFVADPRVTNDAREKKEGMQ